MPFQLPNIEENEDGWGPTTAPDHLEGVPFMPYSKSERLGRIADFGQQAGRGMFAGTACRAPSAAIRCRRCRLLLPGCRRLPPAADNSPLPTVLLVHMPECSLLSASLLLVATARAGRYRDREPAPGMAVFNFEKTEEVRAARCCQ